MKNLITVILALAFCIPVFGQKYVELKDGNGKVIDRVVMVEWAKKSSMSIDNYEITETVKRKDVDGKFRVQLLDLHLLPDHSIQYRSNVAVYYSETMTGFQLIHTGIGFTGFSFPAKKNGFYVVKAASEKELKSMVFGLRKDEVDLYRPRPSNSNTKRL